MTRDNPYPMREEPLSLPSGGRVTVLNIVVVNRARSPGGSFGIQYRSAIAGTDLLSRRAEALEVIECHRNAIPVHTHLVSAQVCNTQAAAEMREPPEQTFCFVRDASGHWAFESSTGSDGQPLDPPPL